MSEIKWGTREVTVREVKPGKFGTYLQLTTLDGKGKTRNERIYDKELQTLVPKVGAYKFGYTLNEESGYPEIVEIEALDGSTSPVKTEKAHEPQQTIRERLKPESTVNDSILLQTCLKVSGEVLAGSGSASKDTAKYAEDLFLAAKKTLEPHLEDVPF
jgi:hypothetical protein